MAPVSTALSMRVMPSSQSPRSLVNSNRRAFSIATAAAAANAETVCSSADVKWFPSRLSVRYRLPKTRPRTRTGTPRKDPMGGWPSGKPAAAGWPAMSSIRMGTGWSMSSPSTPRPVGSDPISVTTESSMPTWMKLRTLPSGPSTPRAPYVASDRLTAACTMRLRVEVSSRPAATETTASKSPWSRSETMDPILTA